MMTPEQITVEIQDLSNRLDRSELLQEEQLKSTVLLNETLIPALISDLRGDFAGTDQSLGNLAAVVESLARLVAALTVRLDHLEQTLS